MFSVGLLIGAVEVPLWECCQTTPIYYLGGVFTQVKVSPESLEGNLLYAH